ncbi:MAG: hypothetical protein ACE15B_04320 [Bryobacteraceae bacterium]
MTFKRLGLFLAAALAAGSLAFAQMDDQMMGNGNGRGHGNGNQSENQQGADDTNYGIGSAGQGMAEMLFGPSVGADGIAYVYRSVTPQGSNTPQLQLAGFNPDGSVKWFVPITGGAPSLPVVGKDTTGAVRIYITLSQRGMDFAPGRRMGQDDDDKAVAQKSKLLIVGPDVTTLKIISTTEVAADRLSRPVLATDTGGATGAIYVIGDGEAGRQLYVFRPDGTVVKTVQL